MVLYPKQQCPCDTACQTPQPETCQYVCAHTHVPRSWKWTAWAVHTPFDISFHPTVEASHLPVSMTCRSGFQHVCFPAFLHLYPCVCKLITGQSAWGSTCGPTGSWAVNKHECTLPCCMELGLTTAALNTTVDLLLTTSSPRTLQVLLFYLHNICRSNYS